MEVDRDTGKSHYVDLGKKETTGEKFARKFKMEPLIPIGTYRSSVCGRSEIA